MSQRNAQQVEATPAELGFRMPAEWERHAATWLGWPHERTDWPGKMQAIEWVYGEMIRKIGAGERVRLCVNSPRDARRAREVIRLAGGDVRRVDFLPFPTNRGWMRDSGPIHVTRAGGEKAIVHFHFNAWAKYPNWRKDRRIPELAARKYRRRLFHARAGGRDFVIEGGGIEVNGRGTLLTTLECYQHPTVQVRNPGLDRAGYEAAFKAYLGVTQVFWLAAGPVGDDTHGHIDDICRFVNPTTVVLIQEKNPKDVNYKPLAENWERIQDLRLEDGSKPEVVALPMPGPLYFGKDRLPASYANFYIANEYVLVPTFNDPQDRVALGILGELFKDRQVVGIHAVDLVLGYGTLHCLTQQEPA
ncbi:MAG: agmatine deiminase family protein [Verrucomicrobiae bacterium]|nr:agmatine deiminase family protein [Verrucomicrobiae bacterium]